MNTFKTTLPVISRLPLISISLGLCATLLFWFEGVGDILQYDRLAIADGELWRSVTGHWTHWSFDHFLWDTIVFVALGAICEKFCRRGYLATLLVASLVISAAIWHIDPEMELYRGLSGLCSSTFIFGVAMLARMKYREKDWTGFFLSLTTGTLLIGKIIYEFTFKHAIFINSSELFSPAPLAHLVGGAVGLGMALYFIQEKRDAASTP